MSLYQHKTIKYAAPCSPVLVRCIVTGKKYLFHRTNLNFIITLFWHHFSVRHCNLQFHDFWIYIITISCFIRPLQEHSIVINLYKIRQMKRKRLLVGKPDKKSYHWRSTRSRTCVFCLTPCNVDAYQRVRMLTSRRTSLYGSLLYASICIERFYLCPIYHGSLQGSTPSDYTGPDGAYSGDNYMYAEASTRVEGDKAALQSDITFTSEYLYWSYD